MAYHIKLFGPPAITHHDIPLRLAQSKKGVALIAYLLYAGKPVAREMVADLLWDATSTGQALNRLRELLSRIRRELPVFESTRKTLYLPLGCQVTADLSVFQANSGSDNLEQRDIALQQYSAPFLDGFYLADSYRFNDWLVFAQEQLRQEMMVNYHHLCAGYFSQQKWELGESATARWLKLDSLNEEAIRWHMRFLQKTERAKEALALYQYSVDLLDKELGIEPDAETIQLAQEIQSEQQPAAQIGRLPHTDSLAEVGGLPINSFLPFRRNDEFVGRRPQLVQIAQLFSEQWGNGRPSIVALSGIGGIGKTQSAVEFCYRYGRYFSGGVYWLSFAETEDVAEEVAVIGSERCMALVNENEELTLKEQVSRVQKAWQSPEPRLLIFDNCEDELLLRRWAPTTGGVCLLLTSRRQFWPSTLSVKTIHLDRLTDDDCITYLQNQVPTIDKADAQEIAAEIGHLPLALYMTGGFLRRYKQITPRVYLAQLQDKGLLQHPALRGRGVADSPTNHELSIARTFMLGFSRLTADREDTEEAQINQMAQKILGRIVCFAPGEPITRDLLQRFVLGGAIQEDIDQLLIFHDGIERLLELGFVRANSEADSLTMHRLQVAFTRQVLPDLTAASTAVERIVIEILTAVWEYRIEAESLKPVLNHLRFVTANAMERKAPQVDLLTHHLGWIDILAV